MRKIFFILLSFQLICSPLAMASETPPPSMSGSNEMLRERKQDQQSLGGYTFYANQILSLGTGIMGSNILVKCSLGGMQPSMYVYMAGALGYIGMEMWAAFANASAHNKSEEDLKMLEESRLKGGDFQLETLKAALKDEQATKSFLEVRKYLMGTLSIIFAVAGAVAAYEFYRSLPPPPAGPGQGVTDYANCNPGAATVQSNILAMGLVGAFTYGTNADMSGGTVGTVLNIVKMALTSIVAMLDSTVLIYSTAVGRMISFGVSALLVSSISIGLGANEQLVNQNIRKLSQAISHVENNPKTISIDEDNDLDFGDNLDLDKEKTPQDKVALKSKMDSKNDPSKKRKSGRRCLVEKDGGVVSSEDCSNPVRIQMPRLTTQFNDPTLGDALTATGEWAQAIANGEKASADIQAGKLHAMGPRIREIKDQLEKKVNEQLKKMGKPEIDFEARSIAGLETLQENMFQKFKDDGVDLAKAQKSTPLANVAKSEEKFAALDLEPINTEMKSDTNLDPLNAFEKSDEKTEATPANSAKGGFSRFESTVEDISKTPEVSIFKQLSHRYYLNYPKILKKKGPESKESAPQKH